MSETKQAAYDKRYAQLVSDGWEVFADRGAGGGWAVTAARVRPVGYVCRIAASVENGLAEVYREIYGP
jgi:hypothetical protein